MTRRAAPLTACVLALVLLTGCSAGSADDPTVTEPTAAAPTTAGASAASPSGSPSPSGTVIEVTYAGGEVTGVGPRVEVDLGEQVLLRFTSDVVEEIHVHGYDLYTDLQPGVPAEIELVADIPGSFEVELHEAGRPLFQLRVAP